MATHGGARVGAGRPADPNAIRRNRPSDTVTWTHLSAAGRGEPAPGWPLTRATKRELELWEQEWARPQAVMWERNGLEREVALYVRSLRMGEAAKATTDKRKLVNQYMNDLGISMRGLIGLRWIIDQPVAEGPPQPDDLEQTTEQSDKERFLHVVAEAG